MNTIDWKSNYKEWKCECNMTLPYWGSLTEDGFIRCQECKRLHEAKPHLLSATPTIEAMVAKLSNKIWNQSGKHTHEELDNMIREAFQPVYAKGVDDERERILVDMRTRMKGWHGTASAMIEDYFLLTKSN